MLALSELDTKDLLGRLLLRVPALFLRLPPLFPPSWDFEQNLRRWLEAAPDPALLATADNGA